MDEAWEPPIALPLFRVTRDSTLLAFLADATAPASRAGTISSQ
jgi:hypothetical protein